MKKACTITYQGHLDDLVIAIVPDTDEMEMLAESAIDQHLERLGGMPVSELVFEEQWDDENLRYIAHAYDNDGWVLHSYGISQGVPVVS